MLLVAMSLQFPSPLVDTQLYAVCTLRISNLDLTVQRLSQTSMALSMGPGVARGMAVEPGLRPAASTPYDLEQSAMQDVLTNDATGSMLPTDTLVLVLAVVAQQVHGSVCVSLPSRARVHLFSRPHSHAASPGVGCAASTVRVWCLHGCAYSKICAGGVWCSRQGRNN